MSTHILEQARVPAGVAAGVLARMPACVLVGGGASQCDKQLKSQHPEKTQSMQASRCQAS